MKVSSDGGTPEVLTTLDADKHERSHRFRHILPSGEAVLFLAHTGGSMDDASIVAASMATGEHHVVTQGNGAQYIATGHLLYDRGGTPFAAPFDPDRLEITGNAVPVVVGVDDNKAGVYYFAVSETGTLVYRPAPRNDRRLVLVDLDGRVEPLAAPPLEYQGVRFSPDGRQLVTTTSDVSVHLYELEQERFSLLFSSIEVETDSRIISGDDSYDLSPDGQSFVMKEQFQEPIYTELYVVQNWFQELKRLVPTDN